MLKQFINRFCIANDDFEATKVARNSFKRMLKRITQNTKKTRVFIWVFVFVFLVFFFIFII